MRLGLFGGSFDPVHYGHLILAEQCREQCQLDEVWFVPARQPPHKFGLGLSSAADRMKMLQLATFDNPVFQVSDIELRRDGLSYTVETLQQVHEQWPDRELFFLLGADSLLDFPNWREPERIVQLAKLVAVNRGGTEIPDKEQLVVQLGRFIFDRVVWVEMPEIKISATDIRQRVRAGRSIRYLVPPAVEQYIKTHALYTEKTSSNPDRSNSVG